jgi:pimeloyl-ACP methyl ester carboxylesterase
MPFATIGEENIFFSHSKSSERNDALLLIHGSGGSRRHWHDSLRNLPGIHVYGIDLPGHGQSRGQGRRRVEDYADLIESFVSELKLSRVTVAGHSLGGAIAQVLALRSPKWLLGLILVGTGARLRVAPDILDGLLNDFSNTVDLICSYAFGPSASASLIQAGHEDFLKNTPEVMHGDFSACHQFDLMGKVSKIAVPTLILSGSADRLTPVKYGEYLYQHIPGAKFSVIKDAGHLMGLEKPEIFVREISGFLFK